jgi:CubicO group peptidase (beta-lactamase class C family)
MNTKELCVYREIALMKSLIRLALCPMILAFCMLNLSGILWAAEQPPESPFIKGDRLHSEKTMTAVRANPLPPKIDGVLDDEVWQYAPIATGFTHREPKESGHVSRFGHLGGIKEISPQRRVLMKRTPISLATYPSCGNIGGGGNAVDALDREAASEAASYQDLQPDAFMTTWLVLGPISVTDEAYPHMEAQKEAFAVDFLADQGGESGVHPAPGSVHKIGDKEYTWQLVRSESDIVNLIDVYGEKEFVVAYAWAEIEVPEAMTAVLGIGSDDGVKVWLNGELVHENWIGRAVNKDDDVVGVSLRQKNQLLLKVQNQVRGWGFACRILGPKSLAEKLVSAAGEGDLDALELLLLHEVDVNATAGPGLTALHSAKIRGRQDVVEFLLEKGADPSIEMPAKEKLADAVFDQVIKAGSPGAALAVIKNGSIVYKNGYGSANLEYDIPITPSTVFHVASVSKQFTAFAIAMLAERGKLSLDDDIHKYLPDVPDFGRTITIRHLVHHTSGLRDQWQLLAMAGWRLDDVITKEHIMKMVRHQKELNFDPGEEHLYCNTGYTLLAEIVERVSGQSFREYTEANIFKPLGMANTHFHDDHEMIVKNRAYSYAPKGDGGFKKSVLSFANVGATSLFTTVEDLAKWIRNFDDAGVGGAAAIERMHEKGVLNDGKGLDYAFGLNIGEYRGLKTVGHGGSDAGYRSDIVWFPEQKFGVVVLSNLSSFNPRGMAMQVADIYLIAQLAPQEPKVEQAERKIVSVDPAILDTYTGVYQLGPGWLLTVTKEDGRLMAQATGEYKFEMLPESETKFYVEAYGAPISFERDEADEVTQLAYRGIHAKRIQKRTEPFTPNLVQLAEFVGDYYSGELGTIYTIVIQNGKLVAQHRRHEDISLTPTVVDQFSGSAWWFQHVCFKRDEDQKITGFRLTGGRVRDLRFDKLAR